MSSEKTLALVLRVTEFSETSCVVRLFTRDFGKLGALAKGARRPKSPFEAALDVLALVRIVFLHKSSDVLDLLTEARLERRFRSAGRDLSRLYAAYYVAELLDGLTDMGDPHPELFEAADCALMALDTDGEVPREVLRFEMTALRELGHLPSLDVCVQCGRSVAAEGRVAFGQLAGGALCRACRSGHRQVVSVSAPVVTALKEFAAADDSAWRRLPLEAAVLGELRAVLNRYLYNVLGRRPRMHAVLGGIVG